MPFFASTQNPAQGLGDLAQALFPDPSKAGQAQLMGAQARQADAQTQDIQSQTAQRGRLATAQGGLPDIFKAAVLNPTPENLSAAYTTAAQAGYKPDEISRGVLAFNKLAPGRLPQNVVDAATTTLTGGAFGNTETGFGQALSNQRQVASIGAAPGMLNAQTNAFAVRNQPQTYVDPSNPGTATSITLGQQPPANFVPVASGASQTGAIIAGNAPRTSIVPGNGPGGYVSQTQPALAPPNPNSIPLDTQNPAQTAIGAGLFGAQGPAPPAPMVTSVPPAAATPTPPASSVPSTGAPGGLAGIVAPPTPPPGASGTNPAAADPALAQTAPAPAPPIAPSADAPTPASTGPTDLFRNAATASLNAASTAKPVPGKQMTPKEVDAQIDAQQKKISDENTAGHSLYPSSAGTFDAETRSRIKQRAAELSRDRSNRQTWENDQASLAQAIQESSTGAVFEGHGWLSGRPSVIHGAQPQAAPASAPAVAPGGGNNFVRQLPPTPAPAAPPPTPAPVRTPAAPLPSPAAAQQVASAAPQPYPADPAKRTVGQVYLTGTGPMIWQGAGWSHPLGGASLPPPTLGQGQ